MLARTGPVPGGDGWAFEMKFDGMRLQLRRDGCAVCLRSRPGRDCSEEFPELAAIKGALGRHPRVLLDGELVCLHRSSPAQAIEPELDHRCGHSAASPKGEGSRPNSTLELDSTLSAGDRLASRGTCIAIPLE
jgi:ATP-dependent DNA ligase